MFPHIRCQESLLNTSVNPFSHVGSQAIGLPSQDWQGFVGSFCYESDDVTLFSTDVVSVVGSANSFFSRSYTDVCSP